MGEILRIYDTEHSRCILRDRVRDGDVPIAVYGLGKIGLPLAAVLADVSKRVTGVDINQSVVDTVNEGDAHVAGEPGLESLVDECVSNGWLQATTNVTEAAAKSRVHVVIVPTLLTDENEPDLSLLKAATEHLGAGLSDGDLVIVESTVPPRTCREVVLPLIERTSGLTRGSFGVAFCPERTSSGRAIKDIRGAYPKVVGGIDAASAEAAAALYEVVNEAGVSVVSDATTAETVKLLEGIYRDVNIGLANELARMADELVVDINEAIDVANEIPFCDIHTPGPGVGGHCIPYYPYFLISPFDTETPLLETARQVNDSMPSFTIDQTVQQLSESGIAITEATTLIAGLTYRSGVEETRAAPALDITAGLTERGSKVLLADPFVDDYSEFSGAPIAIDELATHNVDAVIVVTPHEAFEDVDWETLNPTVIIDGRQSVEGVKSSRTYTIGSGLTTVEE